jgi:exosome complex protein LRP1
MDTVQLLSLVEHLEDNIDELEDNLEPLLSAALTTTTKKLPLLDKAKLYVLIVYSIESLLFCEFQYVDILNYLTSQSLSAT